MKKLLALLLALVMILSLVACSSGDDDDEDDDDRKSSSSQNKDDDEKDKESDNEEEDEDSKKPAKPSSGDEDPENTDDPAKPAAFEAYDVINNDDCVITITDVVEDDYYEFVIKVKLENKTADTNLQFYLDSSSINGLEASLYLSEDVAAGKKANGEISVYMSDYSYNDLDIGDFTDIELNFTVSDADDFLADPIAEASTNIYPYGESNATAYEYVAEDDHIVLVDNEYATVIATAFDTLSDDEYYKYVITLYIVNKSGEELDLRSEDDSINGYMMDSYFYETIQAGNCAIAYMTWTADDFAENGIEDITEIEWLLIGAYSSDWESLFEENISLIRE